MYAAKLIVIIGDVVVSGSLWFVVMFLYLLAETTRTIIKEEQYLTGSIPGYVDYKSRTSRMLPFVF